jgi:Tol biopolymer transport system component
MAGKVRILHAELVLLLTMALLCAPAQVRAESPVTLQVKPVDFGLFKPQESDSSTTINAAFSPDGRVVYFSKSEPGWTGLTIFETHREGDAWSSPEVAPFSGIYRDTDPAVTPDGKTVIFASMRDAEGKPAKNFSLFRINLDSKDMTAATPLGAAINDGSSVLYPSVAQDGTLYFVRTSGKTARIVRSELRNGEYSSTEVQEIPGDSDTVFDSDPTIAPDQNFIVFTSNRTDSLGSNDLYLSFRHEQKWCAPIHFEAPVNSAGPELATGLSRDGRTLYFASARSSVKQPRAKKATTADFRAELSDYENGTMRMYQADLGAWLDAHRNEAQFCKSN